MGQVIRTTLRVADGGRIVIPAEVRHQMGIEVGSDVVLTFEKDHATLMNAKSARKKARDRVRRFIGSGASLSRELMAERKAEARRA